MAICLSNISNTAPRSTATAAQRTRRSLHLYRSHSQRLALRKRVLASLATKHDNRVESGLTPATTLHLPRTLPRHSLGEINTTSIAAAYPELAGVAPQYIRDNLRLTGAQLLEAATRVRASPPRSSLPGELEVVMNDTLKAARPTHMLAVYSNSPSTTRRNVTLFPAHHLVLAAHCTTLSSLRLPNSPASAKTTLPVVPLQLPSPETFPLLQSYLYTKDIPSILAVPVPSDDALDVLSLTRHAMMIHGIWRNACALGVVDEQLFDLINEAWGGVVDAIEQARS